MDQFIASYTVLQTSVVAGVQKLGILTVPIVLVIAFVTNYFGGEKAIRAVGLAIAVVAVLTLLLNSVLALSNWLTGIKAG